MAKTPKTLSEYANSHLAAEIERKRALKRYGLKKIGKSKQMNTRLETVEAKPKRKTAQHHPISKKLRDDLDHLIETLGKERCVARLAKWLEKFGIKDPWSAARSHTESPEGMRRQRHVIEGLTWLAYQAFPACQSVESIEDYIVDEPGPVFPVPRLHVTVQQPPPMPVEVVTVVDPVKLEPVSGPEVVVVEPVTQGASTALTKREVMGLTLTSGWPDGLERSSEELIAPKLGYKDPRDFHKFLSNLKKQGKLPHIHVRSELERTSMPRGGVRETLVDYYHLTERELCLACVESGTEEAWTVKQWIVDVFLAAKNGTPQPTQTHQDDIELALQASLDSRRQIKLLAQRNDEALAKVGQVEAKTAELDATKASKAEVEATNARIARVEDLAHMNRVREQIVSIISGSVQKIPNSPDLYSLKWNAFKSAFADKINYNYRDRAAALGINTTKSGKKQSRSWELDCIQQDGRIEEMRDFAIEWVKQFKR